MAQDPEQYFKDLKEWQDNQYLPGYFVGSRMPFSLKQFGKKRWFRLIGWIYLIMFFGLLAFAAVQMVMYIASGSS